MNLKYQVRTLSLLTSWRLVVVFLALFSLFFLSVLKNAVFAPAQFSDAYRVQAFYFSPVWCVSYFEVYTKQCIRMPAMGLMSMIPKRITSSCQNLASITLENVHTSLVFCSILSHMGRTEIVFCL